MSDRAGGALLDDWRGDFASASERMLQASLSATVSQRLQWLEDALVFAHRVGALKPRPFVSKEEWDRGYRC